MPGKITEVRHTGESVIEYIRLSERSFKCPKRP